MQICMFVNLFNVIAKEKIRKASVCDLRSLQLLCKLIGDSSFLDQIGHLKITKLEIGSILTTKLKFSCLVFTQSSNL